MDTGKLKKFAQEARRRLMDQVAAKLEYVLHTDSAELREKKALVDKIRREARNGKKDALIERVAYTWFNRFCALRFMDVHHYTRTGVVSPLEGHTQPEILLDAKQGVFDANLPVDKKRVLGLLSGNITSPDPQGEAYRLLLVAACNAYHAIMPFMFEQINDYTELLMPDDLLSPGAVPQRMRQVLTPEACRDVEVIGWLYQFYISEKKDQVIGSKQKIKPEDIPAATQLFTPHWIVRYLVENSLGRLWLLNHPGSRLRERMDYYIPPETPETDFPRVTSPEELRVLDPACGSGHMLTYAFDLLHAIYEEAGYDPVDIPRLILEKNLYGIEIDTRAGALAAFALMMKAAGEDRRFLTRRITPNICVMEDVTFQGTEIAAYREAVGNDLFTQPLFDTLRQFGQATLFGSLIRPRLKDVAGIRERLEEKGVFQDLLLQATNRKLKKILEMAGFLGSRYHVVVANPPYMGSGNMPDELKRFAKDQYPVSKADLFAMFMERNLQFALSRGLVAMITMQSWMFLSSYEKLRPKLLEHQTILNMAHLGPRAFDTIGGEVVSTTAFVLQRAPHPDYKGAYLRLIEGDSEAAKAAALRACIHNPECGWFYRASAADFKKIPGGPIAYWVSDRVREIFVHGIPLEKIAEPRVGMQTSNNAKYLRLWYEVNFREFITSSRISPKWIKYLKGGPFRRWYGNLTHLLWYNHSPDFILQQKNATVLPLSKLHERKCTWTDLTSGAFNCRIAPNDTFHDISGHCIYPENEDDQFFLLGFCNTKQFNEFIFLINSSFHFQVGDVGRIPVIRFNSMLVVSNVQKLVNYSRIDWDAYETSWDFTDLPLLRPTFRRDTLAATYAALRAHWRDMTLEMQRLEEENNRLFIEAYGLQEELTPDVPIEEITLTCNPHYRYGGKPSLDDKAWQQLSRRWPETTRELASQAADLAPDMDDEVRLGLEQRLLTDTMREFISYAVGCMFGRYALDKPGLILANQGETLDDFLKVVPRPRFLPDEDSVIPLLDEGWFTDDITERFKQFLKVTFGEARYEGNLAFIESALGKTIRAYFLRDFYADHVRRYKKRPIYWLFSSPKGSFNALVYMHRVRPDTLSVILNDYLREFRVKLNARMAHLEGVSVSAAASKGERTRALKEIEHIRAMLAELKDYEDNILYPLATRRVEIDLDDGVKVNYNKFGKALRKVAGLSEVR